MSIKKIATNRRARFDYEVFDTFEAGMVLLGSEVKSLREGRANLSDAYAIVKDDEMWLIGCHISPYPFARGGGQRMYFKDGKAKLELGIAKGKDRYDKRETLKRKQADREMERAMRYRSLD